MACVIAILRNIDAQAQCLISMRPNKDTICISFTFNFTILLLVWILWWRAIRW